jgi:hypothetical protein
VLIALAAAVGPVGASPAVPTTPDAAGAAPIPLPPVVTQIPHTFSLNSVSCPTKARCYAVGVETLPDNGAPWAPGSAIVVSIIGGKVGTPVIVKAMQLYDIACASAGLCVIAGETSVPLDKERAKTKEFIAVLRNGKIGHAMRIANAFPGDVVCPMKAQCDVFGSTFVHPGKSNVLEGDLAFVTVGKTVGFSFVKSTETWGSVTCPVPSECIALGEKYVGEMANPGLVRITKDAIGGFENISSTIYVSNLFCHSVNSCVVFGSQEVVQGEYQAYLQALNGQGGGTAAEMPGVGEVFDVARLNATYDIAVGINGANSPVTDVLAGGRPGTPQAIPAPAGWAYGVSCAAPTVCVAVGLGGFVAQLGFAGPPGKPVLKVTSTKASSVTLSITPTSDGGSSYTGGRLKVERCEPKKKACVLTTLKTVALSENDLSRYTVTGLAKATTYYFRAALINGVGAGPLSAIVHGRTKTH